MIKVKNVTYHYQDEDSPVSALNNVSFTIDRNEWVAIVGRNGSGKSTLAKILDGLLSVTEGSIQICGLTMNEENIWDIRKKIGIVFQNPDNQFVGATVQDDVAFGLENFGIPREDMLTRVEDALKLVNMWEFKDREPSKLSGGQKQRVAIAGVLALRPEIIILDEATAMLDPNGREEIIRIVKELKEQFHLTVISITHDIEEASLADRVFVMKDGKLLYQAKPEKLFTQFDYLHDLGLSVPFSEKIKELLRQEGLDVPKTYLSKEGLVNWLWELLSNK